VPTAGPIYTALERNTILLCVSNILNSVRSSLGGFPSGMEQD
jgi:hypothetical protein